MAKKKIPVSLNYILFPMAFVSRCIINISFIKTIPTMIYSISLFEIITMIKIKDSERYFLMRKISTIMYFTHLYVWTFYYTIVYKEKMFGMDCFLATILGCLIIAFMYIQTKNLRQTGK